MATLALGDSKYNTAPKGPSSQVETLDFPCPPPISETSFDDFAFPAIEDMMMLDQVISDK